MAGGGRSVLGSWLVVMATGTIALLGVAAPAAGLDSLPVSPVPVTVGPVSVDPGVVVSPGGDVHAGVDTTTPASDPSVSVDVGQGGATISGPGGVGVGVALPSPSVPISVPTNPVSPPAGRSAQSPGTSGAPSAPSPTIPSTNRRQRGDAGVTAGQSVATNPANSSNATPVLAPASIAGHLTTPGEHTTPWAQIASAAVAVAPWLVLLGLALFVRALMAAAGRRAVTAP